MSAARTGADPRAQSILERALSGEAPGRDACVYLLGLPSESLDAALLRAVADTVSRRRFQNEALLLGQIGVDMAPCSGGCAFCAFAEQHTTIEPSTLTVDETVQRATAFAEGGASGIFIMTMHSVGFDWLVELIAQVSAKLPESTRLLANVGDVSASQIDELKAAGLTGAYHVLRLREGVDTVLDPKERVRTVERILEAGLDWYNSCEPIGPEHSPEELVDQILLGVELGCHQHAAMRRFPVPGSRLFPNGQLSLSRLAQVIAVIALACLETESVGSIAVHESNLLGLVSGANALYPEAGEPADETEEGGDEEGFSSALWRRSREITTADCRTMLREAGFERLRVGRGTRPLA